MSDSLVTALSWIESLLFGSVAAMISALAIAALGFAMLQGRIPVQRGARVIFGCFILVSARSIASAFVAVTPVQNLSAPDPGVAFLPSYRPTAPPPENKDPYAGAAVPPPTSADPL